MVRLTRQQVREVDRLAVERYHIPGVVLMENAARGVATAVMEMAAKDALIVCGGGNNGGDGLAAARHLHNFGLEVRIALMGDANKYTGEARVNWEIARAMNLPVVSTDVYWISKQRPGVIVDAIFGTGLSQPPRAPFGEIAGAMMGTGSPIVAVDLPSGMDCDTGRVLGDVCVRAARTVTFVAEKAGFGAEWAKEFLGRVMVADIGCPAELVDEISRSF